jgi:hypothetical protein
MKFAFASLFLGLVAGTSAHTPAMRNMLSKARKLEDQNNNGNDQAEEEEYAFLQNYQLKLVSCNAGEQIRDPETGEYEYNAAVFRLCPGNCDDESAKGCSSGSGDYVVGLSSFVTAYFEDQRDNMYYDDNFKVDEYAECRAYEPEDDDQNQNQNNGYAYYIGPACTDDGKDVKLQLYYDETCSSAPEDITFEDISNGWSLPYGEGGLVSTSCQSCTEYGDNGYELKEMCTELYMNAGKCETNMESYHYYGKQEGSCEYISSLMPAQKSGSAGKTFGWVVFVLVVVGAFSAYVMWWKKKKAGQAADGLMA